MLAKLAITAMAALTMATGAMAQEAARAYHMVPVGTQIFSVTGTFQQLEGSDAASFVNHFEAGAAVATPTYRGTFDVGGNLGMVLVALPLGGLSTTIDTPLGTLEDSTGFTYGDLILGGAVGLIGSEAMSPMEYAQAKPGFRLGVAGRVSLPTGNYDSSQLINLGSNRWTAQASLPISYVLGDSWLDPNLMTFEIMPTVKVFGDNNDPTVAADVVSQAALFQLEGHVSRSFGNKLWAALDAFYEAGGETSRDGVARDDANAELALGATLGVVLTPTSNIRASYRQVVYSNQPDAVGHDLQITTSFLF